MLKAAPDAVPFGVRTETTWVGVETTTIVLFAASEPVAPGAGNESVALLLIASVMVPPLSTREEDD